MKLDYLVLLASSICVALCNWLDCTHCVTML